MDIRLICAPSEATMQIIRQRSRRHWEEDFHPAALGLVQGRMIDMIVAADIAEKTAGVRVTDVQGSCPQNMVLLAIAGETAEVKECLGRIEKGGERR